MAVLKDEFDQMIVAIREALSKKRLMNIAAIAVRDQQRIAADHLFDHSPEAILGYTLMTTGHQHISVKQGWENEPPKRDGKGVEAIIINKSEHVRVQMTGTRKKFYQIPHQLGTVSGTVGGAESKRGTQSKGVTFWWGAPLKWRATKVAKFRKPGFVHLRVVSHPGFGPWGGENFVGGAIREAEPAMNRVLDEVRSEVMRPLRQYFNE